MNLSTALDKLARHRMRNTRASQEIFDAGIVVLDNNAVGKLGDDSWAFLEQLALAAIDVGRVDVADTCLKILTDKFPGSPRVETLTGIRMEASGPLPDALAYYDALLQEDPTHVAAWKRKIAVLRRQGKIETAVEELSQFLDTFYTDVEGWLELADIYTTCNQPTYAFQSLTHVLLLAPQNPFYLELAAEAACVAGDIPLAYKMFLQVIDMTEDDDGSVHPIDIKPSGVTLRAWAGVRECTKVIRNDPKVATTSASKTPAPEKLPFIERLALDRCSQADDAEWTRCLAEMPEKWRAQIGHWIS